MSAAGARRAGLVAACLAAAVVLSACGGGATSKAGASATPSPTRAWAEGGPEPVLSSLFDATGLNISSAPTNLPAPGSVAHVRLWDAGVSWAQVETSPGTYDFGRLDTLVAWAESGGADVTLVLGPGPRFYSPATSGRIPWIDESAISPPTSLGAWVAYVDAVTLRYRGRIAAYEAWNEVDLPSFYEGTPEQLAALARTAYDIVKRNDPDAVVTSPSTANAGVNAARAAPQYRALAAAGWPFDVWSIHSYPKAGTGIDALRATLAGDRALWARTKAPVKPVWLTEVNRRGTSDAPLGAAETDYIMTSYTVEALQGGISRVYWYAWNSHTWIPQITTVDFSDTGQATVQLAQWQASRDWLLAGCTTGAPDTCRLTRGDGSRDLVIDHATRTVS